MKWTTQTKFVDLETGEIITKQQVEKKNYVVTQTMTKYTPKNKTYGIREITKICERNRQTTIKF